MKSPETLFVIEEFSPELMAVGDEELIDIGWSMCGALDGGAWVEDLLVAADDLTGDQASTLIAAPVAAFCPEHQAAIE